MKKVVCVDYPRPELENTVNFLEAAALSSSFRSSARPAKPLKVVIAGAGDKILSYDFSECQHFLKFNDKAELEYSVVRWRSAIL